VVLPMIEIDDTSWG